MTGGFQRGPKTRRITFDEGSDFPGLWMRVRGLTIGEWLDIQYPAVLAIFVERLEEWNWEDEQGNQVPCTMEAITELDASDIRSVVGIWVETVAERRDTNPLVTTTVGSAQMNGSSPPPDPALEASMPTGPPPSNGPG